MHQGVTFRLSTTVSSRVLGPYLGLLKRLVTEL